MGKLNINSRFAAEFACDRCLVSRAWCKKWWNLKCDFQTEVHRILGKDDWSSHGIPKILWEQMLSEWMWPVVIFWVYGFQHLHYPHLPCFHLWCHLTCNHVNFIRGELPKLSLSETKWTFFITILASIKDLFAITRSRLGQKEP